MMLLTDRYAKKISGVLSCFDRVVIQGTLPTFCYAEGMTGFLYLKKIKIFDYPRFAEPLRDELRENAEQMASENGLEIEFIRKKNFRKEDRIRDILNARGAHPGLSISSRPWSPARPTSHGITSRPGKTFLIPDDGKCLHYYFYFVDEDLGLCYVRVPTWLPFRLQICFNGHNWLAGQSTT